MAVVDAVVALAAAVVADVADVADLLDVAAESDAAESDAAESDAAESDAAESDVAVEVVVAVVEPFAPLATVAAAVVVWVAAWAVVAMTPPMPTRPVTLASPTITRARLAG